MSGRYAVYSFEGTKLRVIQKCIALFFCTLSEFCSKLEKNSATQMRSKHYDSDY